MSKNPLDALPGSLGNGLGEYLREQRLLAKLSVRQLSAIAGVSNPYLSQIERGVKRPSADILQQIAKGLSISAETLYVHAGLLDPEDALPEARATTRSAIRSDPSLTPRQRQTLLEVYDSFVGSEATEATKESARTTAPKKPAAKAAPKKPAQKTTTKKKAAGTRSAAGTKSSPKASGSTTSKSAPRSSS